MLEKLKMKAKFCINLAFLIVPLAAANLALPVDCVLAQRQEFSQSSTATVIVGQPPASVPCGWPTTGYISTLFGDPTGVQASHSGIDIAVPADSDIWSIGQDVFSTVTGTVADAWWDSACGGKINVVSTVGETTYLVRFVHLSQSTVNSWQGRINTPVTTGTLLGRTYAGALGTCSNGTHLHYEIYVNGALVNPVRYTPGASRGDSVTVGGCGWTPQRT